MNLASRAHSFRTTVTMATPGGAPVGNGQASVLAAAALSKHVAPTPKNERRKRRRDVEEACTPVGGRTPMKKAKSDLQELDPEHWQFKERKKPVPSPK